MIRIVLAVAAIALGVTAVSAQRDPIAERNVIMKSNWRDAWGPLTAMVQGKEPYDQAKVNAAFTKLADNAAKLPPLWPENSKPPRPPKTDYYSSLKVWQNKKDFDARLAKYASEISENRSKATSLEGLKVAYQAVNAPCDGCHEIYQLKKR